MKNYFNFKKKIKMNLSEQQSNNIIWVCIMCTEDTQNCYCIFVCPIGIDAYRIATLRDYYTKKEISEILLKGKLDLIKKL
jgi:heterodisulfide reductase subunit C